MNSLDLRSLTPGQRVVVSTKHPTDGNVDYEVYGTQSCMDANLGTTKELFHLPIVVNGQSISSASNPLYAERQLRTGQSWAIYSSANQVARCPLVTEIKEAA